MLKDTFNKGISTPIAISIVLILVVLVGGFTWWQYGEMWKEEGELPEIELPEKIDITEEDCDKLQDEERENCYIKLVKIKKDSDICIKEFISPWLSENEKEAALYHSSCYLMMETLKFHEKEGAIPLAIANSDEKLKRYIADNFDNIYLESPSLFNEKFEISIVRDNIDQDQKEEIIIVTRFEVILIREKQDGFYITSWDSIGSVRAGEIEDVQILKMIKDQPKFIVKKHYGNLGHCYSEHVTTVLKLIKGGRFFEEELEEVWRGSSEVGTCGGGSKTQIFLEDIDKDRDLEIIRDGYNYVSEYNQITGRLEGVQKEKIYEISRWSEQEQNFLKED